jgi:hypothetical protein
MSKTRHHKLVELPKGRPIAIENRTCVFCGGKLNEDIQTKEHVVGRRFVPKGQLNAQWNLIVNACRDCNGEKSDLENDISAITMQPNVHGQYACSDEILKSESDRKGRNSFSRLTKKPVKDSSESIVVNGAFSSGHNGSLKFDTPPQIEDKRVYKLARLQLSAFFYYLTYDTKQRIGRFWSGKFAGFSISPRSDWGSKRNLFFMNNVHPWEPRFLGLSANEYFKIVIRKHPSKRCWSYGLEWNMNYRVLGMFGDERAILKILDRLPPKEFNSIHEGPNEFLRYSLDEPISEVEDNLFKYKAW